MTSRSLHPIPPASSPRPVGLALTGRAVGHSLARLCGAAGSAAAALESLCEALLRAEDEEGRIGLEEGSYRELLREAGSSEEELLELGVLELAAGERAPEPVATALKVAGVGDPSEAGADAPDALAARAADGPVPRCAPLLRTSDGRLLSRRQCAEESDLIWAIAQRLAEKPRVLSPELEAAWSLAFPDHATGEDHQALAARAALERRFTLITGGPGTGKTTTVLRILALLLVAEPGLRIGLCAPTGKAADRLAGSIAAGRERLSEVGLCPEGIPEEVTTLHRRLGVRPGAVSPRHGPDHPLPLDVLVIDEASMVDQALFAQTARALAPEARWIVLGDAWQLASVGAGAVLAELVSSAESEASVAPPSTAARVGSQAAAGLRGGVVRLLRSRRFAGDSAIAAGAQACREGSFEGLSGAGPELRVQALKLDELVEDVLHRSAAARRATTPEEAFAIWDRSRLLFARRTGPDGLESFSRLVTLRLREALGARAASSSAHGRPMIIRRNDARTGLANGEVGVIWAPDDRPPRAVFVSAPGASRSFSLGRLPRHDDGFALTIHQAQGSEHDEVHLVLPRQPHEALSAELLLTGITRARRGVWLYGSEGVLRDALSRRVERGQGLGARLRAALLSLGD